MCNNSPVIIPASSSLVSTFVFSLSFRLSFFFLFSVIVDESTEEEVIFGSLLKRQKTSHEIN